MSPAYLFYKYLAKQILDKKVHFIALAGVLR